MKGVLDDFIMMMRGLLLLYRQEPPNSPDESVYPSLDRPSNGIGKLASRHQKNHEGSVKLTNAGEMGPDHKSTGSIKAIYQLTRPNCGSAMVQQLNSVKEPLINSRSTTSVMMFA